MKKFSEFVQGSVFSTIIFVVIILNSIILGLQTSTTVMGVAGSVLNVADRVCLAIFVIEMIMKMVVLRLKYFKDGWNWFDMVIILISIISDLTFLSSFRVFRVFRVFRSLKSLRSLKLVSSLKSLRVIILAIIRSLPSIGWSLLLMLLIYYIFSIIGVTMFGAQFPDWFGHIGKAMYTLFQVMTLESWSMGISRPVMEVFPLAWMYFVPFVLISSFIVMNVVVGIVVNAISDVAIAQKKEELKEELSVSPHDDQQKIRNEISAVREHLLNLEALLDKVKQE